MRYNRANSQGEGFAMKPRYRVTLTEQERQELEALKTGRQVTFDGAFEARLIALACSETPEGRRRWTVRLLAEKAVEVNLAPSVSHMTVQRILKKTNLSLISGSTGKTRRRSAPLS